MAACFPGWPAGGPRREPGSSNWPLETLPCVGWNQPRAVAELKLMSSFMGTRCWETGLALLRICLLLCWGCHPVKGKQPVWRGMEQLRLCCTGSEKFKTYLPPHLHGLSQLPCPFPPVSWESPRYVWYLQPLNLLAVSAEGCPIAPVAIWDSLLTIGNRHPASKSPGRRTNSKPELLALL